MLRASVFALVFVFVALSQAQSQQIHSYTNMSHSRAHGTQIEYVTQDGRTFLWYPGNRVILEGRWKHEGDQMCFAYGANTFNPATGHAGGGWECMPYHLWWGAIEQRMPGDIYSLEGRQEVPFVLDRRRTSLEDVLRRVSPGAETPSLEVTVNQGGQTVALSCESIIANADNGPSGAANAIGVFMHGRFMGKACGQVDYIRAYELAVRAGRDFAPYERVLRERAAIGNPRAIAALRELGL